MRRSCEKCFGRFIAMSRAGCQLDIERTAFIGQVTRSFRHNMEHRPTVTQHRGENTTYMSNCQVPRILQVLEKTELLSLSDTRIRQQSKIRSIFKLEVGSCGLTGRNTIRINI